MIHRILKSVDGSINYIIPYQSSFIECRYVRRQQSYVSTYLSSHNGCKMGCKFCWLTQQKQTHFDHVTIDLYDEQLKTILSNIPESDKQSYPVNKTRINMNFMARGEALANKYVIKSFPKLHDKLMESVNQFG